MRVIAGRLGGRNFASPHGHRTHPMSDKIRGALFNALGDIEGLTVLDAFAGSGALSFEAVSRGAGHVTAIDSDKSAQRTIAENIANLDLQEKVKLISASANAWLETSGDNFDVVLLDPPYDNVRHGLLRRLAHRTNQGGVIVISLPPDDNFHLDGDFDVVTEKDYGDAKLVFCRRVG